MKLSSVFFVVASFSSFASAIILENGHVRETNYPNTKIDLSASVWKSYPADAKELSYKGRWDSKHISWWTAPGLKFGFTGKNVAITFGNWTSEGVLIGYRVNGQDWQFSNISASATHQLVSPSSPSIDITTPISPSTLELRVTNYAYGIQISQIHVSSGEKLVKLPNYGRTIEVIGDSLAAGMYATYEGLSGFGYNLGAGLGNTEYSLTAYPGICVYDKDCWGNPHGQFHQWFYTSDTSWRASQIWGEKPERWDFSKQPKADLVFINIGTNDANAANNVTSEMYYGQYKLLIEGVHGVWPEAQIILSSLWNGFGADGNTYAQGGAFVGEIYNLYTYFNSPQYLHNPIIYDPITNTTRPSSHPRDQSHGELAQPFVHYFNTTGILQHNDIGPQWHPTDVGHVKVASHLIQYTNLKFGWDLLATGPEVQHDTLYWNSEQNY